MVVSFRGKNIDMVRLAKRNEHKMTLGNSSTNARGDIIGRGGKIIKTREEQLKEYEEKVKIQEGNVSMKNPEQLSDLEKRLQKYTSTPEKIISKKKKVTEEKKEESQEETTEKEEIIYDEE